MINYDKQNRKVNKLNKELGDYRKRLTKVQVELEKIREVLNTTMHEARRFNSEIYATAESLHKLQDKPGSNAQERELCETIYYTSGMLSARFAFADIELNPAQAIRQARYRSGIYKKFEKARYVLAQKSRANHIQVVFKGNSYLEIETLPSFELVPFILLDNALKYSPHNQQIIVEFDENTTSRRLSVTVNSLGPVIDQDEITSIFDRKFRGRNASSFDGEGLGLYVAKNLCDRHSILLTARCDVSRSISINGIRYGDIDMCLEFGY